MCNLYSGLDRGNEEIDEGVNLRLPSGTTRPWGNLDYDVNLVVADKAFDQSGQLFFDIFDFDGALGDAIIAAAKASNANLGEDVHAECGRIVPELPDLR